jgi:hypothetical protein
MGNSHTHWPKPLESCPARLLRCAAEAYTELKSMKKFRYWLSQLGWLRSLLAGVVLLLMFLAPSSGAQQSLVGWNFVTNVLSPALAPIVFMVLLFDVLMATVLASDAEPALQNRYRIIRTSDLLLCAGLLLAFLPTVLSLVK